MREGVRYQIYDTADGGLVLFMASEQAFWKNFCQGVGRTDLFERWPGSKYADHARGNAELHDELVKVFATRTSEQWLAFGEEHNTPIAPVNTPGSIADDAQFRHRLPWIGTERLQADMLPFPLRHLDGSMLPPPTQAPAAGEHTEEVLRAVLGYDEDALDRLRAAGAFGDGPAPG